jgi:hypothetical protein
MIHHIAFVELLCQLEREGAEQEWRETWAGLLVLRLYHLWHLNPETARPDAPGAVSVRGVVDALPESTPAKQRLTRILDTLGTPATEAPAVITRLLGDYASGLAHTAHWSVAHDVYQTAGMGSEAVRARGQ